MAEAENRALESNHSEAPPALPKASLPLIFGPIWSLRIGQQSGHQTPISPIVSSTPRSTPPGLQRLPLRGIRSVSVACFLSRVLQSDFLHPQSRACIGGDWPREYSLV